MPRESTDNDRLATSEGTLVQSNPGSWIHRFWKTKLWRARVLEDYRLVVPALRAFDAGQRQWELFLML